MNIGIFLFEGFEELDFVGPWEVFGVANQIVSQYGKSNRLFSISVCGGVIKGNKNLRIVSDFQIDTHPPIDLFIVPGGNGTRKIQHDKLVLQWIVDVSERAKWVASVCTGALLLYKAGVAKNRNVATHWSFEDTLQQFGEVKVIRDKRWVIDGKIITSQGVSAGIDMSLWLVGELYGANCLEGVIKEMQYYPEPPTI